MVTEGRWIQEMEDADFSYYYSTFFQKKVALGLAVGIGAYFLLRRNPRVKFHLDKLGGPMALPVLGNVLQFLRPHNEIMPYIQSLFKKYGTTYRFWVGNFVPYAATCDVHVIEKLISGLNYNDKGKYEYSLLHDWLGTGLLTAPGCKWTNRRKILTPSFHLKILEEFTPVFNEQASVFVNSLERESRNNGNVFNIYPYVAKCTLDIICETAMGKKINAQTSDSNKEYFDAVHEMCSLILDKSLKPWLRVPVIYRLTSRAAREERCLRILTGFTKEVVKLLLIANPQVIRARKVERKSEHGLQLYPSDTGVYRKQRRAFLDLLLDVADENPQFTDADIREEVDTFMFEGHDTTAINLAWTILLLAMHPECQQLVHDEMDEIFAENPTGDLTGVDVAKMKYLECCIKESLRMFPSVPQIMRQVNSDLRLDNGKLVPKGATVVISIYSLHRLAEHFPEPNKFLPERWLSGSTNCKTLHHYAYLPFSAGPRNCIGRKFAMLEEKIVLAKLFREFHFTTKETLDTLKLLPDIVLRSDNGVNVSIKKRQVMLELSKQLK